MAYTLLFLGTSLILIKERSSALLLHVNRNGVYNLRYLGILNLLSVFFLLLLVKDKIRPLISLIAVKLI